MIGRQELLGICFFIVKFGEQLIKGDAMNLTLTFQNNMLGVGLGLATTMLFFGVNGFLWMKTTSLNMISTCLEHKTRIT